MRTGWILSPVCPGHYYYDLKGHIHFISLTEGYVLWVITILMLPDFQAQTFRQTFEPHYTCTLWREPYTVHDWVAVHGLRNS